MLLFKPKVWKLVYTPRVHVVRSINASFKDAFLREKERNTNG